MNHSLPITKVRTIAATLCAVRTPNDLAALLHKELFYLQSLILRPAYHLFTIPKRDGTTRWIEDPPPKLKSIQRTINRMLECAYHLHRSNAAFGFMIHVRNDPDERNILTNAKRHLYNSFLVKFDLEDFFHQVKTNRIVSIFMTKPFNFDEATATLISGLCTHDGRLPMGSPASSSISNFATLALDNQLEAYCTAQAITYTRFVDDMSFSSARAFTDEQLQTLKSIIDENHFIINESKFKVYQPDEERIITGLKLTNQVELTDEFAISLELELKNYRSLMFTHKRFGGMLNLRVLKAYEEKIEGSIRFAGFIMGDECTQIAGWKKEFEFARDPPLDWQSMSWLELNYRM